MAELSDATVAELIAQAKAVRRRAYAPYSQYPVGAALLARSGEIYLGANVENAAYPVTVCAERSAVFHAVSCGETDFLAIAVVNQNGGMPCGACRQVLSEFGLQTLVVVADGQGRIRRQATVAELLPDAFGPEALSQG